LGDRAVVIVARTSERRCGEVEELALEWLRHAVRPFQGGGSSSSATRGGAHRLKLGISEGSMRRRGPELECSERCPGPQ
jgi:hypothetical protein